MILRLLQPSGPRQDQARTASPRGGLQGPQTQPRSPSSVRRAPPPAVHSPSRQPGGEFDCPRLEGQSALSVASRLLVRWAGHILARGSCLDMWTAAGNVQVTSSGRAAMVPWTFMLSLFRDSNRCERRLAGLRLTPDPGLPSARSPLGRHPLRAPPLWETALACL